VPIDLIKVTSPSFSKNDSLKSQLLRYFPNSVFNSEGSIFNSNQLKNFLKDSIGAVIGLEKIDEPVLQSCKNLKVIAKFGVGLDNIDQVACKKYGIQVLGSHGVNKLSVAELTLGFMIALCRNFYRASLELKNGKWNKTGGYELSGKTVGIIGVGNIGKEVVRLLQPFHCKILVNDILDQVDYYKMNQLIESTKENLFKKADIVTIHTPLTAQTKNIVNKISLASMKKGSFLINTSRGPVINQQDLKEALIAGTIAGAAIDVYETEPPEDQELLRLPNLICSPHIGGASVEAVMEMGLSAINQLKKFFKA